MISEINAPDSAIARQAEELARSVSSDMLFNHVMRCYWFGELFAQQQNVKADAGLLRFALSGCRQQATVRARLPRMHVHCPQSWHEA